MYQFLFKQAPSTGTDDPSHYGENSAQDAPTFQDQQKKLGFNVLTTTNMRPHCVFAAGTMNVS